MKNGLGVDLVSGGEIKAAIKAGFPPSKIVYAGVGKTDWEINLGLDYDIFCFNVESIPELEIINELAAAKGKIARVAFRINPDVGAHTHANITTGLAENKFGISMKDMDKVIDIALGMNHVKFVGLHFHIGSQILDMGDFIALCNRINQLQEQLYARQIIVEHINVGGGLGIDYAHPNRQSVPDFAQTPAAAPAADPAFRAGTRGSGTVRQPHHEGNLRQARHQQAVRHRRRGYDRPDSSGPVPSLPQDREPLVGRTNRGV